MMRSSLARTLPSAQTADEIADRRKDLEPTLYRKHGVVILRRDDPDLTGMERLWFDALVRRRFGVAA